MNALLLIDLQNDFLPGGSLPVPHGDEVIDVANRVMPYYDTVLATQDWHPRDHLSFASQHPGRKVGEVVRVEGLDQILWSTHCVQGTPGASFAAALDVEYFDEVIRKGTNRLIDSYSAFFDNHHRHATGLGPLLRQRGIDAVDIMGLATDYCVLYSVLDAMRLGLEVRLIADGCRGVDLKAGDVKRALRSMRDAGAWVVESAVVMATLREGHEVR